MQDRMVLDSAVQNSGTHKMSPDYSRLRQDCIKDISEVIHGI